MVVKDDASRLSSAFPQNGSEAWSQKDVRGNPLSPNRLKTINIYNALPHLLDYEDALTPALIIGKERYGGEDHFVYYFSSIPVSLS